MKTYKKKLLAVGDDATGKATLLYTMCNGSFPESWYPIVAISGDVKEVVLDKRSLVELVLWTAPGLPRFKDVRPLSYEDTKVIFLCYAIDNRTSYDNIIKVWVPEIRKYAKSQAPVILVATKRDKRQDDEPESVDQDEDDDGQAGSSAHDTSLFVSAVEGKELATAIGAMAFVECSAKTGDNVEMLTLNAANFAITKYKRKRNRRRQIDNSCVIF